MSGRHHAPDAGDPFGLLLDFERRSLAHVAGLPEQFDAPGQWRGLGFRIGERRLASLFDDVIEILPLPPKITSRMISDAIQKLVPSPRPLPAIESSTVLMPCP